METVQLSTGSSSARVPGRSYRRGAHPDKLVVGISRCPLPGCHANLGDVAAPGGAIQSHACVSKRCRYCVQCPGHERDRCILKWVAVHQKLPRCASGHVGCWVLRRRKGRVFDLTCYGPTPAAGRTFCGSTFRHWLGEKPSVPHVVGGDRNPNDLTKFQLLEAFSRYQSLTIKQAQQVSGLSLGQVQAATKRLRQNKLPLLEFAGEVFDAESCRMVNRFSVNKFGATWVRFHADRGTFDRG